MDDKEILDVSLRAEVMDVILCVCVCACVCAYYIYSSLLLYYQLSTPSPEYYLVKHTD